MAISMLKIRRPLGRLIFNMGIAIPGKTVFLIETAPRWLAAVVLTFFYQNIHAICMYMFIFSVIPFVYIRGRDGSLLLIKLLYNMLL